MTCRTLGCGENGLTWIHPQSTVQRRLTPTSLRQLLQLTSTCLPSVEGRMVQRRPYFLLCNKAFVSKSLYISVVLQVTLGTCRSWRQTGMQKNYFLSSSPQPSPGQGLVTLNYFKYSMHLRELMSLNVRTQVVWHYVMMSEHRLCCTTASAKKNRTFFPADFLALAVPYRVVMTNFFLFNTLFRT